MPKAKARGSRSTTTRWPDVVPVVAIALLALGQCGILALRLPVFTSMRGWFWPLHTKPLPLLWLCAPLVGLGVAVVWLATNPRAKLALLLPVLVVLAYVQQLGFGYMEGRGLDGLRDRIVNAGHAGFAVTAAGQPSLVRVAAHYESMVASGELRFYPNSTKPPGQLLFYMLTERLSRPFAGLLPPRFSPLDRLRYFASFFFPLVAALALLPLAWLARMLVPPESANRALVLLPFVPSFSLITLHLDQCLYPLITLTSIGLFLYGMQRRRTWALVLSGAVFYLALYVSFSLAAVAPLLALVAFLLPEPGQPRPFWRRLAYFGLFVAGFILLLVGFALAFHYDPLVRYRNAMLLHSEWKQVSWSASEVVRFGLLDVVEFLFWTGMPLTVLFLLDQARSAVAVARGRPRPIDALAVALGVTLLLLAFAGRTVAETARLWLFLVPLVVLFAGHALSQSRLLRTRAGMLAVVFLQFLTIIAIKRFQDFW